MPVSKIINSRRPSTDIAPSGRAIVFSIDANYLPPLKVFLYSIAMNGKIDDVDLVLITEDEACSTDAFVRNVFDKVIIVEQSRRDALDLLAKRILPRKEKAAWTRATLLKWEVFDEFPYEQVLFLDADMLCLGPLDGLFAINTDIDVLVSPQFRNGLKLDGERRRSPEEIYDILQKLIAEDFLVNEPNSLNSGVMLLQKNALTKAFRNNLDAFTMQHRYVNEQRFLNEFIKSSKLYNRILMSSKWNFHEEYINLLPLNEQIRMFSLIHILHFAGPIKPWASPIKPENRLSQMMWHWMKQRAESHFEARQWGG